MWWVSLKLERKRLIAFKMCLKCKLDPKSCSIVILLAYICTQNSVVSNTHTFFWTFHKTCSHFKSLSKFSYSEPKLIFFSSTLVCVFRKVTVIFMLNFCDKWYTHSMRFHATRINLFYSISKMLSQFVSLALNISLPAPHVW